MLGDLHAARAAYENAADSAQPDIAPRAARELGLLCKDMGDSEGAITAYRRAIRTHHPEAAPTAANNLGNLLSDLGDVDGAIAAYRYAVESRHAAAAPDQPVSWDGCWSSGATSAVPGMPTCSR